MPRFSTLSKFNASPLFMNQDERQSRAKGWTTPTKKAQFRHWESSDNAISRSQHILRTLGTASNLGFRGRRYNKRDGPKEISSPFRPILGAVVPHDPQAPRGATPNLAAIGGSHGSIRSVLPFQLPHLQIDLCLQDLSASVERGICRWCISTLYLACVGRL